MHVRVSSRITAVIVTGAIFITHAMDVFSVTAYVGPDLSEILSPKTVNVKSSQADCLTKMPHLQYPDDYWKELSDHDAWEEYQAADGKPEEDKLWETRYLLYQELMSQGSAPMLFSDRGYFESDDGTPLCLLHGRADVLDNAEIIKAIAYDYPEIPPIIVAAAIAEQASDVERIFGVDILEKTTLSLPGKENMSIGIAQLRPTEVMSLGLGSMDLFDPVVAVRGMYAKLDSADERISLHSLVETMSPTDRYMLLSLAQNNAGSIDDYNKVDGDWDELMRMHNYARVMRYFLVHLDWLVANGWDLPDGVDLDRWRRIAFSSPRDVMIPPLWRRS